MKIIESFYSFQGEGKFVGMPAVFMRFSGCNLSCKGFGCEAKSPKTGEILLGCDTIRAVAVSHFNYKNISAFSELQDIFLKNLPQFSNSIKLTNAKNLQDQNIENKKTSQLLSTKKNILKKYFSQKPIVVITGGEALLWHKENIFYEFINWLLENKFSVHFETNGTIKIDFEKYTSYKRCIFAVGVKLSSSMESRDKRLKFDALEEIFSNSKSAFYKFALNEEEISSGSAKCEINEILEHVPGEVYCMPVGKNRFELDKNAKSVVNFCLENGFCYSDRVHIRIYDDLEGV